MTPQPQDAPLRSLAIRRALMIASGCLALAGFVPVLLQYQGLIDAEGFGVPETFLYVGGFGATFIGLTAIFVVWRCPGCGAYLGRDFNPPLCAACGARFRDGEPVWLPLAGLPSRLETGEPPGPDVEPAPRRPTGRVATGRCFG